MDLVEKVARALGETGHLSSYHDRAEILTSIVLEEAAKVPEKRIESMAGWSGTAIQIEGIGRHNHILKTVAQDIRDLGKSDG